MSTRIDSHDIETLKFAIPVWVIMAVLGILVIFLSQLIILHVYLLCNSLTTY